MPRLRRKKQKLLSPTSLYYTHLDKEIRFRFFQTSILHPVDRLAPDARSILVADIPEEHYQHRSISTQYQHKYIQRRCKCLRSSPYEDVICPRPGHETHDYREGNYKSGRNQRHHGVGHWHQKQEMNGSKQDSNDAGYQEGSG